MVNRPGRPKPTKSKRGFSNYKPPSYEEVKKRATRKGGRFDSIFQNGFDSWRAKEGSNHVRILPPTWANFEHYSYEVWVHKNVGSDNSTYLCLNKNKDPKTGKPMNKNCPMCNASKKLKADGDADGAKEIQVTTQYVPWIIDREAKKPFPPLLWQMSWTQDRDLSALSYNDRSGKTLPIAHAEEGYDVNVKRMGTGLLTKYILQVDREESAVSDDDDTFAQLEEYCLEHPVPSTLKFYDEEYLENVLSGASEEKDEDLDEDEDEDDKPKRRRSRDDDEDDDDDADDNKRGRRSRDAGDEDEDEDEDDKPKRGGVARRKLKKEEPEEEEEETDEDEDEDEKPARGKSRSSQRADEDEGEEEEDEEKPRTRRRKPSKEDDNDDTEEDTDEDEDEEDKPRARKRTRRSSPGGEEEEERPRKRSRR